MALETMTDALARLEAAGYTDGFRATDDGLLRCAACGTTIDPAVATIDEVVRFEGASDPDEEAALFALGCAEGHLGVYVVTYGPAMPAEDVAVVRRLSTREP